jgi:hypothetical protein
MGRGLVEDVINHWVMWGIYEGDDRIGVVF